MYFVVTVLLFFSQSKHLQFVSGVHSSSYWLATFAWDMVNCLIPIVAIFILFAAFNITGFQGVNLVAILLLLVRVEMYLLPTDRQTDRCPDFEHVHQA